VTVDGASIAGQYTLTAGNINIPADVFTTAGNYAIIVKATGFTDATVTQTMAPAPAAPVAAFTADTTSGTEPLTVNFTDASTGTTPLTYAWDFNNDSIVDSTVQNPSHQYSAAGTYSVKLTVTNSVSSDEEIKTDYITVSPAPVAPVAAFTAAPLSGTAPLTVNFTDASTGTGPLTYAWDFNNDGTVDSTLQNPTYIYSTPGTYSVKLTVNKGVDSDEELKTDYITVGEPSAMDVLYDGTVNLTPGETFDKTAYNSSVVYTAISKTTPLGALQEAAEASGFTYDVTDKNFATSGTLY
jgi:PKD repeat protein